MYSRRAILNVCKDTDSTTFLDDVCHCMVTLMVKKSVSWCSARASCALCCAHFLWSCSWTPMKRAWLFLIGEMCQSLNHPHHPVLECVHALRSPELGTALRRGLTSVVQRGRNPSLILLAATLLLTQPCLCQEHVVGTPLSPWKKKKMKKHLK